MKYLNKNKRGKKMGLNINKKVEVLLFAEYGKDRSNIDDLKESIKK